MKKTAVIIFCSLAITTIGQNKTIGEKNKNERETVAAHKVMLIPFEPKLYLGEIDHQLNAESKLSSREIRRRFRDGLNEQLYKSFKASAYNVLDLMDDTVKYRKDIEGIYQYLTYEYMKVPNQDNYKAPKKDKEETKIEKGQLNVETNSDKRFMNAKITNAKVVPLLYGKYKTDLFVFINQLDIQAGNSSDPSLLSMGNSKRLIRVHYTVYSLDAREINSGVAEEEFDQELNNQKKIIEKHFSKIAQTIVQRVNKGLLPAK